MFGLHEKCNENIMHKYFKNSFTIFAEKVTLDKLGSRLRKSRPLDLGRKSLTDQEIPKVPHNLNVNIC